jgi:pentatricopeptide repeat protein
MDLSGPYNMAIRACAAGGEFDTALKLLEQAMAAEHLRLTNNTVRGPASEDGVCHVP